MGKKARPIPVLLGPTASGKTALVSRLDSGRFEVVSVDSRQVYRGLEISSAAPSKNELAQMPHHLVSVLSPDEPVDAAWFVKHATKAILKIQESGKIPILAGGAGFYFLALESGGLGPPPALPEVRKRLSRLGKEGRRRLFAAYFPGHLLSPPSPKTEASFHARQSPRAPFQQNPIHPNDDYRISRALEVALTEKLLEKRKTPEEMHKAASHLQSPTRERIENYKNSHNFHFAGWWLHPPKEEWWKKIRRRVRRMLEAGMVEEVLSVYEQFGNCPGLASLGCFEIIQEYEKASGGHSSVEELEERIAILHRQYGKRQRTWFRNKTTLEEILPEEFVEKITLFLEENYD